MKHKVGDKIKITGNTNSHEYENGAVVTIEGTLDELAYNCGEWYVRECDCELYTEPQHTFTHPKDAPDGHKWVTLDDEHVDQVTWNDTSEGDEVAYIIDGNLRFSALKDAPADPKVMWVNVYDGTVSSHPTRFDADDWESDRTACIRVEYHEGQYDE